jgi:hypothetical protein
MPRLVKKEFPQRRWRVIGGSEVGIQEHKVAGVVRSEIRWVAKLMNHGRYEYV